MAASALLARAEGLPFGGRDLMTMVTLSWALFALNIAIQLPLLIRFGYARISVLATRTRHDHTDSPTDRSVEAPGDLLNRPDVPGI
jgi:hypothetical protein